MTFVNFIYTVGINRKRYYGRYGAYKLIDDRADLCGSIKSHVESSMERYLGQPSEIHVCIISCDEYGSGDTEEDVLSCYDMYISDYGYQTAIYVNGQLC
jgi:hypothetical protein